MTLPIHVNVLYACRDVSIDRISVGQVLRSFGRKMSSYVSVQDLHYAGEDRTVHKRGQDTK